MSSAANSHTTDLCPPAKKRRTDLSISPNSNYGNKNSTTTLYSDLVETRTYLQKLQAEEPGVAANFDAWLAQRKLTIETVEQLRQRIDNVFIRCNVVESIGAAAGIVGNTTGLTGMAAEDKKTAENLNTASKYIARAGNATSGVTNVVEMGLTQIEIDKIKRVLQKDSELTKLLRNWIQFSHDVNFRFKHLFDLDIASDTFFRDKKVWQQCIKLLNSGNVLIVDLIGDLSRLELEGIENLTIEISNKVIDFLSKMETNPELRQPFVEIWNIVNDNPHILELAKIGITLNTNTIGLLSSENIIVRLLKTVCRQILSFVPLSPCALNFILFASNIVTLILAVKNLQEGASKYSESLDKVKTVLRDELNEVNKQMMTYIK